MFYTVCMEQQLCDNEMGIKRYPFHFSAPMIAVFIAGILLCITGVIITTWRVFTYLADGVVTTYDWLSFGLFYLVSVLFAVLLIAMLIRSQYIITDKQIILQFGLIKTKYEIKDIFSIHRFQGENKLAVYFDDFKTKYAVIVVKDIWYDDFVKTLISRKPGLSFSFSTAEEEEQYKHDNDRRHKK